jgi:hypothetical protein
LAWNHHPPISTSGVAEITEKESIPDKHTDFHMISKHLNLIKIISNKIEFGG